MLPALVLRSPSLSYLPPGKSWGEARPTEAPDSTRGRAYSVGCWGQIRGRCGLWVEVLFLLVVIVLLYFQSLK